MSIIDRARDALKKATPGPWSVIYVNGQKAIANTDKKFLVSVMHPEDSSGEPGASNARLTSLSSDLAAAVVRAADLADAMDQEAHYLRFDCMDEEADYRQEAAARIRSALKGVEE